jgi:hypothetical protein
MDHVKGNIAWFGQMSNEGKLYAVRKSVSLPGRVLPEA